MLEWMPAPAGSDTAEVEMAALRIADLVNVLHKAFTKRKGRGHV